jgi:hypothetical protein
VPTRNRVPAIARCSHAAVRLRAMASDHKDYSGTPLWRKLGIREGARVHVADAPSGFLDALEALAPLPGGVEFVARPGRHLDVGVLFVTKTSDLRRRMPDLVRSLAPDGRLWVAWPKKAAKVQTDLDFDLVQGAGLDAGLVDNKSASVTDTFQGVQFVYRLKDRQR